MRTFQAVVAALFAAEVTEARVWFGECPSVNWGTNFDSAAFAGNWYEQERDAVFTFEMDQMCSTAQYTLNNAGTLDASFRAMMPLNFYQYGSSPAGVMDCANSWNCELSMGDSGNSVNWGVVGTDYNNWHVAYWCGDMMGVQYSWLAVYSKEQTLSADHLAAAHAAIEDISQDTHSIGHG